MTPHAEVHFRLQQERFNVGTQQPSHCLVAAAVAIPVAVDIPAMVDGVPWVLDVQGTRCEMCRIGEFDGLVVGLQEEAEEKRAE